jgi:hypothetical protein
VVHLKNKNLIEISETDEIGYSFYFLIMILRLEWARRDEEKETPFFYPIQLIFLRIY